MSKQMTPKEALEVLFNNLDKARLKELSRSDKYWYKYEEVSEAINVLERLEKVEELLGLYREHHKLVPFTPGLGDKSKRVCDISIEIKQLEKELEK